MNLWQIIDIFLFLLVIVLIVLGFYLDSPNDKKTLVFFMFASIFFVIFLISEFVRWLIK